MQYGLMQQKYTASNSKFPSVQEEKKKWEASKGGWEKAARDENQQVQSSGAQ